MTTKVPLYPFKDAGRPRRSEKAPPSHELQDHEIDLLDGLVPKWRDPGQLGAQLQVLLLVHGGVSPGDLENLSLPAALALIRKCGDDAADALGKKAEAWMADWKPLPETRLLNDGHEILPEIRRIMRKTFGLSDREPILIRRVHQLLGAASASFKRLVDAIDDAADREACARAVEQGILCYSAAAPTLQILLGIDYEKQCGNQLEATCSKVLGSQETRTIGPSGHAVISTRYPFAPQVDSVHWGKYLDLYGSDWRRHAIRQIASFERLMIDLIPGSLKHQSGSRRGRPKQYDPRKDRQVAEAWSSGAHRTHEELGSELGMTKIEIKKAIDRHRKRRRK